MTTVAITGLHRGENPQPGAMVAAGLRRRFPDVRIVGFSYDPFESSLYANDDSRPDAAYLLPYPGAGRNALLERLDEILQREKIDFAIPCLDSEIGNFIALQGKLHKRGISCMLPTRKALDRRSKIHLHNFCRRLDVTTPRAEVAGDPAALAAFADTIGYPVYVKGKFYEAYPVTTRAELYEAFYKIVQVWGGPVIVQEALVGEEYNIIGLGDGEGNIIGSCSIRKMLRTSAGKGFAGIVIADPELDDEAMRIIKALRWKGPFELEFLKVPHKPHALFEMNPRFPAWVDFPCQVECNLPARLLEYLLQMEPKPLRTCSPGQMFIRHSIDVVTDISEIARMAVTGERIDMPEGDKHGLEVIK